VGAGIGDKATSFTFNRQKTAEFQELLPRIKPDDGFELPKIMQWLMNPVH
jgi:hypothetical protein